MSTLYVRDVPEETKAILSKIAADEGTNVSEYVRRMLDDIAKRELRRQAMEVADEELAAIHARMKRRPSQAETVAAVRAVRDEYEPGDAP